jgi:predicted ABC-class ATPase
MFGYTRPVAKCGFTSVAGFCVDFVENNHGLALCEIDNSEDKQHRYELRVDAIAHDPVCMFAVEIATFRKASNANHQNAKHCQHCDDHYDKERVTRHFHILIVFVSHLGAMTQKANDNLRC